VSNQPIINVTEVRIGPEEERLVLEVMRSGHLAQGPMVERLEGTFRDLVGTRHAVALNSGTTALVATLQALDLEPGDEVITSPFTFAATLNAIIEAGAVARFADIGDDFNLRPEAVEALVGPRTRVIMPVHLYGHPADMAGIGAVAARHGLTVVEDAAQAIGATVGGRPVGSFGHGCFSLYATKNVTSGEGGMVTTDDDTIADRLRVLRNQGMRAKYEYVTPGHNYRMTDLQAAVAVGQMSRLEEWTQARRRHAAHLTDGLDGIAGLLLPATAHDRTHVFHQYTVRVTSEARLGRDAVATTLSERGIGTGVYYPRVVFDYECYRIHPGVVTDAVPEAERAASEVLSLPVHPHLTDEDVRRVIRTLRDVFTE
jgi:perosamine synthetase